jgi:AraC family transcriptional regulator of adaptative response/methylated-DNA-[protein]-cysteine methyltransferase
MKPARQIEAHRIGTPFGPALLGICEGLVAWLSFHSELDFADGFDELARHWQGADIHELKSPAPADLIKRMFGTEDEQAGIGLLLRGTSFQQQVWRGLCGMPTGSVIHYGELAKALGRQGAARATGSAVGANAISWLIPCHRVVPVKGGVGQYRWGSSIKREMLILEAQLR